MRSDYNRLIDIKLAISLIRDKIPQVKDDFIQSDLLQVWVLYYIQVIGEAANGISPELQEKHQTIPWKDIIAMRHLLVHQYFGIDIDEVWNTVQYDLPKLEQEIAIILKNL